jgi:hypothetical protein|tara:strand:- start:274 stop:483 length:210 start_codon:yes stop_codon:yes gene_type:complete
MLIVDCEPEKSKLEKMAEQPKSVAGDQGQWTNHSLAEQIELDRYESSKKVKGYPSFYKGRFQPPSARGN